MGDAPKLPAVLTKRPRPLPKWAPGLGVIILVVVLFGAGGASLLGAAVTIDNTAAKVGLCGFAMLLLIVAGIYPSSVKRARELLVNGRGSVALVTDVRNIPGRYGSNGRRVSYTFEVKDVLHEGTGVIGIHDPRFPDYPKEGDFIFIVYDAKDPTGHSIIFGGTDV